MRIDRCICYNATFAELHQLASETGSSTLEELQAHKEFGANCRLCNPYVREMLKTGKTVFHRIIPAADTGRPE